MEEQLLLHPGEAGCSGGTHSMMTSNISINRTIVLHQNGDSEPKGKSFENEKSNEKKGNSFRDEKNQN